MRTTLTLDDDLAGRLKALARQGGASFKDVVNDAIRRGLSSGASQAGGISPFQVTARACGLKPGVDPRKLNQIYDDLELEELGSGADLEVHEP